MVVAQQTTKPLAAFDPPYPVFIRRRSDKAPVKPLMWALSIVMRNVLAHCESQMTFAKQDEPVLTLALDRKHEPLCERMEIRTARWQTHGLDAVASEQCSNVGCEDRISVHDEMHLAHKEAVPGVQKVAYYLLHPSACRLMHDATDFDPP